MKNTVLSGRDFNLHSSKAKQAANDGPVFITDRGKPTHVLLHIDLYNSLIGKKENIADLLAMDEDVELEIPSFSCECAKIADLS